MGMAMENRAEAYRGEVFPFPSIAPSVPFGVKEQKDVALLVKVLLRREGLATTVRCTARRLSVTLSGMPSDFGSVGIMNILSVVMAVGHHLEDVYNIGSDFALRIDFWSKGCMATTLGKATGFARRMKAGSVEADEFWGAFDFRLN